ncbi:cytochrome c, class I [Azoarcus sp. CIB]|uniref:c-type cytochrome n=1 Tax=Aromatoleum sp. (strain CIB) TaxID=198107 RepID=UPI0006A2FF20|nr:cytochrome c [Azoarcus sp. CIB]AKU13755.1 cytochrome c, class I [Azoarcus sp. CIB]
MNRLKLFRMPSFRRALRTAPLLFKLVLGAALSFDAAAVGPAAPVVAHEPASQVAAPFDLADPARIEAGRKRFNKTCAGYCHGYEGTGGRAPDFKGRKDLPVPVMFETITTGRVGADVMPPWGAAFSAEQIWELVAYLQYLGEQ